MNFNRTNSAKLLDKLQKEDLYIKLLKDDKDIFMALRETEIDFYYKGAKIYAYKSKGFISHKKYCFNVDTTKNEIYQDELYKLNIITDPLINHKHIKQNAEKYSGIEAFGTSYLYRQDYKTANRYMLLDTEIALSDEDRNDRIDLLLYDNEKCELKFIEAKHFSNSELWSKQGTEPDVVEQITRYNSKISKYYPQILEEYKKYVSILNDTFKLDIELPKSIDEKVSLYMFGFDDNQKKKIEELLKDDNSLKDIKSYFLGNFKKIDIKTLFTKA